MIQWEIEWPLIKAAASKYGVNPYFIAAIRHSENGEDGKQFGVLSIPAPTYDDQLRVCCVTVAHRMALFNGHATDRINKVSIMSREFIRYFAALWAPVHVDNDPNDLNANWAMLVSGTQDRYAANGGPG